MNKKTVIWLSCVAGVAFVTGQYFNRPPEPVTRTVQQGETVIVPDNFIIDCTSSLIKVLHTDQFDFHDMRFSQTPDGNLVMCGAIFPVGKATGGQRFVSCGTEGTTFVDTGNSSFESAWRLCM